MLTRMHDLCPLEFTVITGSDSEVQRHEYRHKIHARPALSSNLGRGKPLDQSMDTFMALVTFQNSIKVPMPALNNTTVLVSLSSKYRKITNCIQVVSVRAVVLATPAEQIDSFRAQFV